MATKIADASTKVIKNDGTIFESLSEFSEGPEYVKHFPAIKKIQLQRKVFVSCKTESSLRLSQFKCWRKKNYDRTDQI